MHPEHVDLHGTDHSRSMQMKRLEAPVFGITQLLVKAVPLAIQDRQLLSSRLLHSLADIEDSLEPGVTRFSTERVPFRT